MVTPSPPRKPDRARKRGVHHKPQIKRRLYAVKLPAFNQAVNQHLSSVEGEALQVLKAQRLKAAEALGELLDSKAPAVRLAAARTVLEITASKSPPTEASAKFAAVLALLESTP